MSDLFHERVPDEYIVQVFAVMDLADWHIYQVLTKRAERMRKLVSDRLHKASVTTHIWLGVSVEDRRHGLPRIDELRRTPAAVRFLSIEPLLEDLGCIDLTGISWVIVGGESGHGARPMRADWVYSIRSQCDLAGVPFFFKQWGGVQKSRNGRSLNGITYDELPGLSPLPVPNRAERVRRLGLLALDSRWQDDQTGSSILRRS
jgi:protein gp37